MASATRGRRVVAAAWEPPRTRGARRSCSRASARRGLLVGVVIGASPCGAGLGAAWRRPRDGVAGPPRRTRAAAPTGTVDSRGRSDSLPAVRVGRAALAGILGVCLAAPAAGRCRAGRRPHGRRCHVEPRRARPGPDGRHRRPGVRGPRPLDRARRAAAARPPRDPPVRPGRRRGRAHRARPAHPARRADGGADPRPRARRPAGAGGLPDPGAVRARRRRGSRSRGSRSRATPTRS